MEAGPGGARAAGELQGSADVAGEARAFRRTVLVLLVALVGTSLVWTVHPWYDPTNDGSMYIATARSLAAGEGYGYLGQPFLIRPPGFSCLIAPLLALRGTDFLALNLFVSLWGALGVVLFHLFLRRRIGSLLAGLVALALWFNPGHQRLCNQVMGDVPGWTLLVLCLLLDRAVRRSPTLARELGLGLAIGFASLVRSGDLLLLPAVVLARAAERFLPRREAVRETAGRWLARSAVLVAGSALVLAPWAWRNRVLAPEPPAEQTLLYSYSTGMWHRDMGDPRSPRVSLGEVLRRCPRQSAKIEATLGSKLGDEQGTSGSRALALVLVGALLVSSVRRRAASEFFALGTLLVVAFYFGYAGRLLLPVFALALAAATELARDGLALLKGRRIAAAVTAAGVAAWIALDWSPRERWDAIERLHASYGRFAELVRGRLEDGERLGAYRGWHHAVYLERPVHSFEFAIERAGNYPAAAEELIVRHDIDSVLLTPLGLPESVQRAERAFARWIGTRYGDPSSLLVRVKSAGTRPADPGRGE